MPGDPPHTPGSYSRVIAELTRPGPAFDLGLAGKLLKQWQAPNVPTIELQGSCGPGGGCVDDNPKCAEWAKSQQCELNPGYAC